MLKQVIVIAGPTAVGKTDISLALAKEIDGEIISADSMQVYRGMDIGTAKISQVEMQGIPHHLLNILEPWEAFNITLFKEKAQEAIKDIHARGKTPILTGGTGFYIQAVLYDIDFSAENEEEKEALRKALEAEYDDLGADAMLEKLRLLDRAAAEQIHKNNKKRLVRAIEYNLLNAGAISEHNAKQRRKEAAYAHRYFVLHMDRQKLYAGIDRRVERMFDAGLMEEFLGLVQSGCHEGMVSMQGIGYKELFACMRGEITLEAAKERIKQNTRHFAKRQLTWFKREKDCIWIDRDDFVTGEALLSHMLSYINFRNI